MWLWFSVVASAQSRGIETDPNYLSYLRALGGLGTITSDTRSPNSTQIAPGTIAFIDPLSGNGGTLAAINLAGLGPPHFSESLVLDSASNLALMHSLGFIIGHEANLVSNNQAGMDTHLDDRNDEDLAMLPATYQVGLMTVTKRTVPTLPQAGNPIYSTYTDADALYELYTFQLTQNGVSVGWFAREEFFHADLSNSYVDHWFFRPAYLAVGLGIADVIATPVGVPTTLQAFLVGTVLPGLPSRYQQTSQYEYQSLDTLFD